MQEYHYFVAHEFSEEKRDDLRRAIEEAFRNSGLKAYYADKEVRQKHILEKIEEYFQLYLAFMMLQTATQMFV
jgi:hypothetical protein